MDVREKMDFSQKPLSEIPIPELSNEDPRPQPKFLKKKSDKPLRRDRDSISGAKEEARGPHPPYKTVEQRVSDYQRKRDEIFHSQSDLQAAGQRGSGPASEAGSGDGRGKAVFKNAVEDHRDPEFQRYNRAHMSSFLAAESDPRSHQMPRGYFEPMEGSSPAYMRRADVDANAAQMMRGLSMHPSGEQQGFMHHGLPHAYGPSMHMPFAYVPGGPIMPQMQGIGLYSGHNGPYGYQMQPQAYPYMPGPRSAQMPSAMMGPVMGPQMPNSGVMPYYPGYLNQGYNVPLMPQSPGAGNVPGSLMPPPAFLQSPPCLTSPPRRPVASRPLPLHPSNSHPQRKAHAQQPATQARTVSSTSIASIGNSQSKTTSPGNVAEEQDAARHGERQEDQAEAALSPDPTTGVA